MGINLIAVIPTATQLLTWLLRTWRNCRRPFRVWKTMKCCFP